MRQALQVLAAAASHMQAVYELEPGLGLQLGLAPPIPDSWTVRQATGLPWCSASVRIFIGNALIQCPH